MNGLSADRFVLWFACHLLGAVATLGMPEARVCKIKWTCANITVHVITSPTCTVADDGWTC